jgi:hypothetical protein
MKLKKNTIEIWLFLHGLIPVGGLDGLNRCAQKGFSKVHPENDFIFEESSSK